MISSPEDDQRVMTIVTAALDRPASQREAYLRLACEGNEKLYREVADAVTCEELMGSFLQHPIVAFEDPLHFLRTGQIFSDRFEIVRKIGEGGMGIVYEAHDRKRDQRIALKFAKTGFQRLLSPELEGALKVRHPNICLVNEIHTARIDESEVDFLTMEFVEGETLSSCLAKEDESLQKEALEIARQLCAGIGEAHRSGIIHRDLKSGNIMLCRMANEGLRVVIMDFGLAGAAVLDSTEGGTPGYMAPELSKGEKASCASDIYALGVILHEIVTDRMPIEEKSTDLRKPRRFTAPSSITKGLDPRWDGVILSCLERSPNLRPDVRKVIAALEKKPLRKAPLVAATLLLVAPLAIPEVREWVRDQIWLPPNVRLAILPFEGATNGADASGGVLQDVSERIRHMSSRRRTVVVISPSELWDKRFLTSDQARDALHATHVLLVKLKHEGEEVVAQCGIIDLATGTPLREFAGRYTSATIGTMPAALAGAASLALGLHGPAVPETLSPAATPAYDRALYLLRKDQESFDEAIASFGEAARIDPRSSLPLAGLVEAKVMKFEQTDLPKILDDARRDLDAAESLTPDSPRVRLAAGLLKKTSGQYEEALDDYRSVVEREPKNEEVHLCIAEIYDKRKMPSEAIAEYQEAIQLEPGYYAGYHGLGVFYYYHGDYAKAAEQFQKSIERAPGLFDDYTNLGAALLDLGRYTDAEKALLTSLKLHETPRALNNMGAIRAYQKRDVDAVAFYKQAVAMDPAEYVYLENLADSDRRLGRLHDATGAYRKSMDIALAALRQDPRKGYDRGFVAYISARLGDRKRAEDEIAQALQMSKGETKVIRNAVLTYEALGERDRAIQVLKGATPELLQELNRQPDLADFWRDSRFKQLVAQKSNGGK
jgi:serine/threonine protein kinase/tetratricopeptide (TPR) repeat protein